jgi:hypothetical protein
MDPDDESDDHQGNRISVSMMKIDDYKSNKLPFRGDICEIPLDVELYKTVSVNSFGLDKFKTPQVYALSGAGYQYQAIFEAQQQDDEIFPIWNYLVNGKLPDGKRASNKLIKLSKSHIVDDNLIYRLGGVEGKQLLVPKILRDEILKMMHDATFGGHLGIHHTLHRISKRYWWPGLSQDVIQWIRSCKECLTRNANPNQRQRRPIVDFGAPRLFDRVAVDVQGEFPESQSNNKYIVTFIEISTRWTEGFPVPEVSAETIASLFVRFILLRFGAVRSLLSDRGSNFLSEIVLETCKLCNVTKVNTSAYHPQTNGNVERIHGSYNSMISKYVNVEHDDWDIYFPYIQHAYRTSLHSKLKRNGFIEFSACHDTPFFLMHGYDALELSDVALLPPPKENISWEMEKYRSDLIQRLSIARKAAAQRHLDATDKLCKHLPQKEPRMLKVGELVMVRNETTVSNEQLARKWQPKWLGPYRVTKRISEVSYEVTDCENQANIRMRNIDDLKPYFERALRPPGNVDDLPVIGESHGWDEIGEDETEVEKILDKRIRMQKGRRPMIEFLVRFKNLNTVHDEWIQQEDLRCPNLIKEYEAKRSDPPTTVTVRRSARKGRKRKT